MNTSNIIIAAFTAAAAGFILGRTVSAERDAKGRITGFYKRPMDVTEEVLRPVGHYLHLIGDKPKDPAGGP